MGSDREFAIRQILAPVQRAARRIATESNPATATGIRRASYAALPRRAVEGGYVEIYAASEVAVMPTSSPLRRMHDWMITVLTRTHPQLGRANAVCPFVGPSIGSDVSFFADGTRTLEQLDEGSVASLMINQIDRFRGLPHDPPRAWRSLVVVFPGVNDASSADLLIDGVQRAIKPRFVDSGLMIGEMHPWNETPARANPEGKYYPNRSPVAALAVRDMHPHDSGFLLLERDPGLLRSYLISYLRSIDWRRIPAQSQRDIIDQIEGAFGGD